MAFLDEPTAGVDPEGRIAVRAVVAGLKEKGVCVLLTTHELGEAEKMADRIVILSSGRIVLEGTPRELTAAGGRAAPVITFGAPAGLDTAALAAAVGPGTAVTETAPGRYRVEGAAAAGPRPAPPPSPPGWPSAAPRSPTSPRGGASRTSTSRPSVRPRAGRAEPGDATPRRRRRRRGRGRTRRTARSDEHRQRRARGPSPRRPAPRST